MSVKIHSRLSFFIISACGSNQRTIKSVEKMTQPTAKQELEQKQKEEYPTYVAFSSFMQQAHTKASKEVEGVQDEQVTSDVIIKDDPILNSFERDYVEVLEIKKGQLEELFLILIGSAPSNSEERELILGSPEAISQQRIKAKWDHQDLKKIKEYVYQDSLETAQVMNLILDPSQAVPAGNHLAVSLKKLEESYPGIITELYGDFQKSADPNSRTMQDQHSAYAEFVYQNHIIDNENRVKWFDSIKTALTYLNQEVKSYQKKTVPVMNLVKSELTATGHAIAGAGQVTLGTFMLTQPYLAYGGVVLIGSGFHDLYRGYQKSSNDPFKYIKEKERMEREKEIAAEKKEFENENPDSRLFEYCTFLMEELSEDGTPQKSCK